MITSVEQVANKFFDYVICGGGTAGLTLATRLSEDPHLSVLVLEAGGANLDDPSLLRPASWGTHFSNDSQTWTYQTIKQQFLEDSQHAWQRGKGLGGSSAINFMCWTKPHASDIDDFERLGNPGWNWHNYQKYLDKVEGFTAPRADVQQKYGMCFDSWKIGTEGLIKLAYPATIDDAELKIQQTLLNAGIPAAPNPLSGDPTGVYFTPNTYDPATHTRSYVTNAYYLPNRDRENLTIVVSAAVHRVRTHVTGNGQLHAVGVDFEVANQIYGVNVKREVILAAGALKSPQILELSGIGKKDILDKIGVPVKAELPGVGANTQEHVFASVSWELRDDVDFETVDLLRNPDFAAKQAELHATGSGMFTKGIIGFAFVPLHTISQDAEKIHERAKQMIEQNIQSGKYSPGLIEQYKIQLERLKSAPGCEIISFPGFMSAPNPPEEGKRYVSIIAAMNHCFSRGTIHSASSDAKKDPEFDPRYLEEGVDLDVWVEIVKFVRSLASTAPLKDMIVCERNPGPEVHDDAQLRDWLKKNFTTTWHTSSSCSMLPKASGGVVDPELKVYGTNNLRVVDLSVMPLQICAHPQATVYAIAEQAADIIKGNFSPTDVAVA